VARGASVELPPDAVERVRAARVVVESKVHAGETVYGVTTGFGSLANVRIPPEQAEGLQLGIVRLHAAAVGPPLSREEARAMLFLRAHVLALGHSGVRVEIVGRMVEMLNRDLVPLVPEQGSLGASGDLAPLAHLALPLVGRGQVLVDGRPVATAEALNGAGLPPLSLQAKEGLALVNGTQGMVAVGILASERLSALTKAADIAAAMTIEAALGTDRPFDQRLQDLRPHPGQAASASNLRRLLDGSEITASHRESEHLVQDAYSLRCAPQVHGATREVLAFTRRLLEVEAGSISDNPIVLPESGEVLSGGNFHGQPVAVALDALAAGTVPLAGISERPDRAGDEHVTARDLSGVSRDLHRCLVDRDDVVLQVMLGELSSIRAERVGLDHVRTGSDESEMEGEDALRGSNVRLFRAAQPGDGGTDERAHAPVSDQRKARLETLPEAAAHHSIPARRSAIASTVKRRSQRLPGDRSSAVG